VRPAPGATWLALLLGLNAPGCAARASFDPAPAAPLALAAEPAVPLGSLQPALPDPLSELLQQVAALRGVEPSPSPALVALSARQLARRASEQVVRDVPEGVRRAQAQLLWRLQLVARDFELSSALEVALAGQLQAFYVGTPPTIFIDRALRGAQRKVALAHELVHALQDRQQALVRRLAYEPDAWDRQSALHALAEADALAVVERLGLSDTGASPATNEVVSPGASLPGVIARSLAAPYLDGRARVRELLAQGGFAAVDAELRDPPRSSHELLHGAAASPSAVLAGFAAPGRGFRLVYSDVLGEQSLRCVLEEWAPRALAAELASGWAGDRVSTFGSTEDGALVWELAFDRPERAAAVSSLLVAQLRLPRPRRAPSGAAPLVAEWTCGAHGDSGVVAVDRRGARLVFASLSEIPVSGGCVPLQAWVRAATGAYD